MWSERLEAWARAVWCSLPADSFNHWAAPLACSHFTSFPTKCCSALNSPISGLIIYLLTPHITVLHAKPLIHWDQHSQKKWLHIRMYFCLYTVGFCVCAGVFSSCCLWCLTGRVKNSLCTVIFTLQIMKMTQNEGPDIATAIKEANEFQHHCGRTWKCFIHSRTMQPCDLPWYYMIDY